MKEEIKEIKSGVGLGSLSFGMSKDDVKGILGEPNETEVSSFVDEDDDEVQLETWHYDDLEMSVGFDEEEDWKLISLGVTSESYTLFEKSLIGLSKEEVATELKGVEVTDLVLEDIEAIEESSNELLSSEKLGINFWFDQDVLSEIQWGPKFNEDESIVWPN